MKIVVILSGGLDSTVMAYKAVAQVGKENVCAISFDYGQRHNKELDCARRTVAKLEIPHQIIDMVGVGKQVFKSALMEKDAELPSGKYAEENLKDTVVPNRNMVMISLAASYAISSGADTIWYGAHSGDHSNYPDCRPEFIAALKETLRLCHFTAINLEAPFEFVNKAEIVREGALLGVPFEDTWSCYSGDEKACGKCTTCDDRLRAFRANHLVDPIPYEEAK